MNWQQIYASSNPEERLETLTRMLGVIEARHNRRIIAYGRLIMERRRTQAAHWVADRRGRFAWSRFVIPLTFLFILATVSAATGLFVMHSPVEFGGPVLFFYATSLLGALAFKPNKRKTSKIYKLATQ